MSEALVSAAAEPVVVTDRGADVVLPALIVDAGPDAVARFLEFFGKTSCSAGADPWSTVGSPSPATPLTGE